MTTQNGTKKAPLAYHSFFVGPKTEGFNAPCVVLDSSNVLRAYVLAIAPETVKRDQIVALVQGGDHKALKAADVVLKARLQRFFKGKEANENDPDGLIPAVGQNGNVVDIPLSALPNVGALMGALVSSELAQKAAKLQEAIKAENEATKRKCTSCGHTARAGQKFCPECGVKLPEEVAPKADPVPETWTCSCGVKNHGRFCANCGTKKPETASEETKPETPPTQTTGRKAKGKTTGEGAPPLEDLKTALAGLSPSQLKALGLSKA